MAGPLGTSEPTCCGLLTILVIAACLSPVPAVARSATSCCQALPMWPPWQPCPAMPYPENPSRRSTARCHRRSLDRRRRGGFRNRKPGLRRAPHGRRPARVRKRCRRRYPCEPAPKGYPRPRAQAMRGPGTRPDRVQAAGPGIHGWIGRPYCVRVNNLLD